MIARLIAGLLLFSGIGGSAFAQDRPGRFDFYVLALSWSPGFCESDGNRKARAQQCGRDQPRGFVVHGLWPQYERGFPENCGRAAWVPEALIRDMADLMPTRGLVIGQWRKHGTCSGLEPEAYFAILREARERVSIPEEFAGPMPDLSPERIESAFSQANPGLDQSMMAVRCNEAVLSEIRICMTRDLEYRACPEVDRRACPRPRISVPQAPAR